MARKVLVRLVDDLDGLPSEGVATVTFSLDGVTYQIDLNEANASKLRDGLADFVAAGRRIGGRIKRGSSAGGRSTGSGDGPAIREWAREQGHELAERGRIPSHIVDAFHAANRGGRAKPAVKAAKAPAKAPMKAAAASKTAAVTKVAATAGRAAKGGRPATTKATKAPATKATQARATAAKSTAKPAAKATSKTTAARTTAAKAAPAKATAAKAGAAKTPAAKAPRATKSTVTAKASSRGRAARKSES
jgi:hypothetical protein